MPTANDMMILPVATRQEYFRKLYTIELARLHATGACRWPVEHLPVMVDKAMTALLAREMPIGSAIDATRKLLKLKTNKATFEFLLDAPAIPMSNMRDFDRL